MGPTVGRRIVGINGMIGCLGKVFGFDLRRVAVLDVLVGAEEDCAGAAVGWIGVVGSGDGLLKQDYATLGKFGTQVSVLAEGLPGFGMRSEVEVQLIRRRNRARVAVGAEPMPSAAGPPADRRL